MPNRVKAEIFGDEYLIAGDADPAYIHKICQIVDARIKELADQNNTFSKTKLAILAAVNLADELEQLKENPESPAVIEEKARKLIVMLDEGIVGDF